MIVPTKEIKLYPNNKPWISRSLKNTIKEKRAAFQSGDEAEKVNPRKAVGPDRVWKAIKGVRYLVESCF
jgi:hypothetical protein